MSRIKKVIFGFTAITLIGLLLPTKILLAHGGSHHGISEEKQENEQSNIENNHHEMKSETHNNSHNTQNSSTSKTKITVNMNRAKNISATENYNIFNLLPKTSELVFLGLIFSPFLLQSIRKEIHNNNDN